MRRFLFSCLLLSASLCADDLPPSTQGKEASGLVNPSARFQVTNGWNMFFNTEFLWWTAKEDGLYYVQKGYNGPSDVPIFSGHIAKAKPKFQPGFRIGFGGNMEYDEWDVLVNWTWFQSNAKGSTEGDLLTLWARPGATVNASSASSKWMLYMNIFDAEMGRSFWVGKHFSMRPFISLRGAWIDQHFHMRYQLEELAKLSAHSDFQGGGLRMGTDLRFSLLGGWSFYGLASGSMLYGYYDCRFGERYNGAQIAKAKDGFRQAASSAQMELGFRWDTYWHKDRYHFGGYACWEQNIWFGLNKMNHYFGALGDGNLEQMNGDLTLSGGTFGIRFDF